MKNKNKEFGYNVLIDKHCDSSTHSGEQFGDWGASYTNTFRDVTKCDDKDAYPDITSIHDFQIGDIAYLVWAEWSSGDSFGNGTRSSAEPFALLKEGTDAFALAEALRNATENKNAKNYNNTYAFNWKSSDGQTVQIGFIPWLGYFESLDNVYVQAVQIGMFKRSF